METIQEFCGHSQNQSFPLSKLPIEKLEYILCFCTVEDLKHCRLVSKLWRNWALKSWQARAIVNLETTPEVSETPGKTMSDFLELLETTADRQNETSRLSVNFVVNYITSKEDNILFQTFLKKYGQHIKMLKLYGCMFTSLNDFRQTIFKYCSNMRQLSTRHSSSLDPIYTREPEQNLEQMEFEKNGNLIFLEIESRNMIGFVVLPWIEYFTNFPNIKALKVIGNDEMINEIFTVISDMKQKELNKLKLENIEVKNYDPWICKNFNIPLLKVLCDANFHLNKLSMELQAVNADATLHDIFQIQGSHLKSLGLKVVGPVELNVANCFPLENKGLFENLTELCLQGPVFQDLTYLEFMPFLKKLVVRKYSEKEVLIFPPAAGNIKLANLMKLEVEHYLNANEFGKLIQWMPNVEVLRIPLNNDTFELVCKNWKNLTSLSIPTSLVDECGLTGLDPDQVKRVNETEENCQLELGNAKPNISSLSHLRRLCMCKDFYMPLSTRSLNFASVLFGFWKAASLEAVHVLDYKVNEELWKPISKVEISEVCGKSFYEYKLLEKTQTRFGKTQQQ